MRTPERFEGTVIEQSHNLPTDASSDLNERFAHALHTTAHDWRLAVDRRLKSVGVSQAGWLAISAAAKSKTPLTQIALAEQLGVEAPTVVGLLNRLVKANLIERQKSLGDRRVKLIALTDKGKQLLHSIKEEAAVVRRILLADIDPGSLLVATKLLEGVKTRIETIKAG